MGSVGVDRALATVDAAAFFSARYDPVLRQLVTQVIDAEGPIRDTALARRIARAHGWQRTGSRIQDRVAEVASTVRAKSQEQVGTFFWAEGCAPGSKVAFRRVADGAPRSVDEVCMEELVALDSDVLAAGKRDDSAMAAMTRELGVSRAGEAIRGRIEQALCLARGS